MANQQVARASRVAEKYDIKTQVSKSEKKLLFFLNARPMSQVNYQATYPQILSSLHKRMLEMVLWIWALPRHETADKRNWHLATHSQLSSLTACL